MPLVRLEMLKGRAAPEKKALFDAVHEALVEAFKIPDDDRVQRLIEYEADDFDARSANYTIVTITAFPGRSPSAKRDLYQRIVAKLGELGIAGGDITIVLEEPPMDDWGIRGGKPASEVDLGYDLDV